MNYSDLPAKWMLRSSNDGVSYGGFVWPAIGEWCEAPDWSPEPECGNGLHGITPEHHGCLLGGKRFELCEYEGEPVPLDDKIKVRRARIIAVNGDIPTDCLTACGITVVTSDTIVQGIAFIFDGTPTVSVAEGGKCYVYGGTPTVSFAAGGACYVYGGTPTVSFAAGGRYHVYDGTPTVSVARGGACHVLGGTPTVSVARGGACHVYGGTPTVSVAEGGKCHVYGGDPTVNHVKREGGVT